MHQWDAFRQTLRELGYVKGQNIAFEFRPPLQEGDPFETLAMDLVSRKVDLIVATSNVAVRAASRATRTIPIVMSPAADPVADGFAISLARPGGNFTGVSILSVDLSGKRLEILREVVPTVSRVAVLWTPGAEEQVRAVETAARAKGIDVSGAEVSKGDDLEKAFDAAAKSGARALVVTSGAVLFGLRTRIAELAMKRRLPAVYPLPSFAHAGGLLVYGPNDIEYYRRAAAYVGRILKGARPSELPIEQPTKFELVINLKSARALGITIPQSLLARADEVTR
jgi:putative ABC transport system substrate-binding protein